MKVESCQKFQELMVLQVYEEIEKTAARRLNNHLASCPSCKAQLQEMMAVKEQFGVLAPPQASEHFVEKCVTGLVEGKKRRKTRLPSTPSPQFSWKSLVPALSLMALVSCFVVFNAFFEKPAPQVPANWLTASTKPKAPLMVTLAPTKAAPAPVTLAIVRPPALGPEFSWDDDTFRRLTRLGRRLAKINRRHHRQSSTSRKKMSILAKRMSRLKKAIGRL